MPPLRLGFLPLLLAFEDFFCRLFDLEGLAFRVVVFFFVEEAFAFADLPRLFLTGRLLLLRAFFAGADGFRAGRFPTAFFAVAFALAATALTAFLTGAGVDLGEAAARPAIAPRTPPTTAPTGPATAPKTAPAAAPAVCLETGGISMFSDDEPDESGEVVDD
ncbi:MAG: hypothetical protein DMF06_13780 [Verrucomicrobia bacterium]|nr:MAG: hypothetical protein DMF06_13780 [Verrucomicrobiota bacterium]